jgi:hypothetical protein
MHSITRHAAIRSANRGVTSGLITLLLQHADRALLRAEGLAAHELDRLTRIVAVVASDGAVITVLHPYGRRGRKYRRQAW